MQKYSNMVTYKGEEGSHTREEGRLPTEKKSNLKDFFL